MHPSGKRIQCKDLSELEILEAVERSGSSDCPCAGMALTEKWPVKVVNAKMTALVNKNLLDYGVSVRCAWLTEAGKARLEHLRNLLRHDTPHRFAQS